jgi:hypothetical protein
MKFIDLINENREDRLIKKGLTVFKALRKGTIGSKHHSDEPRFSYELSNDPSINLNNVGIHLFVEEIKIKELNGSCKNMDGYMISLIRHRFEKFGIVLTHYQTEIDYYPKSETLNENAEIIPSEGLTDENIKKAKLIYKLYNKMVFAYDNHSNYGINLPENYYIYKDEHGELCIKLDKEDTDKLYMFARIKFSNGHHYDKSLEPRHTGLHGWIKERVIKKFEEFNINFIF